ncbi:hypothetical protein BB558_001412 [Smittium angustum]|uniref:General transcription and DNA repair factor IIH subunit TFB4 n=1 Tax=Smittium angustum TaxID=133377 RepID=A0A2U1JBH0_SMIAN|nr:hypothetical protein BB558_001412 [Smittium angustum]
MDSNEEYPSLLVIIMDCNPFQWEKNDISIKEATSQLLVFINAYLALKPENSLAIVGSSVDKCEFFYPSSSLQTKNDEMIDVGYSQFKKTDEKIIQHLYQFYENTKLPTIHDHDTCRLANSLSKALSYINKIKKGVSNNNIHPRIMILSVSNDDAKQYIPTMNSIFAAQKLDVIIDVCRISKTKSMFLEQASEITGGNYVEEILPTGLLQTLLFSFLPDQYTRQFLSAPTKKDVDFRAVCFCHKRVVDIGYVCSACLSIFCRHVPVCTTCQ